MKEAVIVSIVRTAVGKAPRGVLRSTRPDDMAAIAIQEALRRVPALDMGEVEDVILGCAMPEAEQGNNVARVATLRAGRTGWFLLSMRGGWGGGVAQSAVENREGGRQGVTVSP